MMKIQTVKRPSCVKETTKLLRTGNTLEHRAFRSSERRKDPEGIHAQPGRTKNSLTLGIHQRGEKQPSRTDFEFQGRKRRHQGEEVIQHRGRLLAVD
ncbi:hypothetical protein Q1695_004863 [Nippostrongylus brasiliensis]|nr:hypothetical protein Q1695_004863 [Nippostrongylus brasiliensis]